MWPNIWAETEAYVKHCPSCQVDKGSTTKPTGRMQPLKVPPCPWHTFTTDYVTASPRTAKGHDAIIAFVDQLTKYVIHVARNRESTAVDWASMFTDHVHVYFGLPEYILSGRGAQFTGVLKQTHSG